jgi:endonuclease-3
MPAKKHSVGRGSLKASPKRSFKESPPAKKARTTEIVRRLAKEYGDADCALDNETPFQLLVATILSAQCTDARVNMVTPALFKKYPDPAAFVAAPLPAIEKAIQSTGFYRNKAKNIKGAATALVKQYDGAVPQDMASLVSLPGVGRKTANVVLGVAFGHATGVVVDTHVGRLSRRLGMTAHDDPAKVEADLMALVPQNEWINLAHRLIEHGRRICMARRPNCEACVLNDLCPKIGVASTADKKASRDDARPTTRVRTSEKKSSKNARH